MLQELSQQPQIDGSVAKINGGNIPRACINCQCRDHALEKNELRKGLRERKVKLPEEKKRETNQCIVGEEHD